MKETSFLLKNKRVLLLGDPDAANAVVLLAGEEETGFLKEIYTRAETLTGAPFCLVSVPVARWNEELTPWEAPGLRKGERFTSGAKETLAFLTEELLPALKADRVFLCGYSLAGLFALWACRETDAFSGAAGVSPSLWFPGFSEYAAAHLPRCRSVYLSLGDKEEQAKHPVLKTVGDAVRAEYARLSLLPLSSALEWNPGGHFQDPPGRLARGIAWLLDRTKRQ